MITRSLEKAKEAWKTKDAEASKKAHSAKAAEKHKTEQGQYIKSVVYGGLDGIITTFAVVAGVAGAKLSAAIVLIMGFANLLGDGVSMAFGDYLSTKAEKEYYESERKRESWEVDNYPEGEIKEMVELYQEKGVSKEDAVKMMDVMKKHKKFWIDTMMTEELGLTKPDENPVKSATATFLSFAIFGVIPLIAYIIARFVPFVGEYTFLLASIFTGLTLFLLGAAKVKVTGMSWLKSGTEMLIVGGVAAALAYLVGAGLAAIV